LAGMLSWAGYLFKKKVPELLGRMLPHQPSSPNAMVPAEIALGFLAGVVAGADKLTRVAHLRTDPLLPEVLQVERIASQSTLSRFFNGFSQAANQSCFGRFYRWSLEQLSSRKEGYTLDLDTTGLIHEDGHQQGVKAGYTKQGIKPCLHPILGVLAEAKVVVNFWLRAGNTGTINNALGFLAELLSRLPPHIRLRLVRADSGFCSTAFFELLEERRLAYVVAARLLRPIKNLITKGLVWSQTEIAGTCVAEMSHQEQGWSKPRRLILIRHEVHEKRRVGGKRLIECPGYLFQGLVTSLPAEVSPLEVWRQYNGRAGIEHVIRELRHGYGLQQFCCQDFWATEAVLSMVVMAYNLVVLFERFLGWMDRYAVQSLRFHLFMTAGIISQTGGVTTIKLAAPPRRRSWWLRLWERISSPFPNCNAVEPLLG
jgi:Transposase DDE domain group 1